jgi:hypothetical protein
VRDRWSKFAWVAVIVLAISACFVPSSSAEGEEDTGASGTFRMKGTHGFSLLVLAFSRPHFKHGEVAVFAYKRGEAVIYFAPAKVTPTTIDADLGPVGTIGVEFQPSGPPERVHASCKEGQSVSFEPGAWVGTIDIAGEEEFTEVHRDRVKAMPNPFVEAGCGGTAIGETVGADVLGARLVARSASKRTSTFLQANKNHLGARVYLEASIEERRAGLTVSREVGGYFAPAPSGSLPRCSRRSSTLRPPSPVTPRFAATPSPRISSRAISRSISQDAPTCRSREAISKQRSYTRNEPKRRKRRGKGGEFGAVSTYSPTWGRNSTGSIRPWQRSRPGSTVWSRSRSSVSWEWARTASLDASSEAISTGFIAACAPWDTGP